MKVEIISSIKSSLLFRGVKAYFSHVCKLWIFQPQVNFSKHKAAFSPLAAKCVWLTQNTHTQIDVYRSSFNLQVKTKILPLLEEVVQDEFADKVRI